MTWFRKILVGLLIAAHVVAVAATQHHHHHHHHHHSHQPVDDIDPPVYVAGALQWGPYDSSAQPAATVIADNLAGYTTYAQQAKQQGVQILVFNEGGLGMFNAESVNTRDAMLPYCESVPTPTYTSPYPNIRHFDATSNINPCTGMGGNFSINSQMYTISCLAQQLQMILVLNTCDVQTCSATTDPECPSDSRYQYNTQVVFNEHGDLIAKYHKSHLFGGSAVFNQAHPIAVTFSTYFGVTFGTFVCFDILYPEPATSLVKMGITHYVFSSWWDNFPPGFIATMQQQAWSRQHQVALIAANTGSSPTESGGGIYVSGEPLVSLFVTDGPAAQNVRQLIVAKVPITFKRDVQQQHVIPAGIRETTPMLSDDVYTICALGSVLAPTGNCSLITSPVAGTSYTLTATSGTLTCSATITMENGVNETYGLFAYQGVINFPNTIDPLSLEVCGISQCANKGILFGYTVCEPLFKGNTIISSFTVTGTGFRSDTSLFPQLALDNAQVQDTNLITFQDQMNTTRIAQITSGMTITKTMWSAAIFGVVPNPPKSHV